MLRSPSWCAYGFGISDVGKKREKNEDAFFADPEIGLFVVADGMGGHAGGQVASKIAVETIVQSVKENHTLDNALQQACHQVYEASQEDLTLNGMGTTATALLIQDNKATIGHVGDSRAYLIRNGHISQLSEDHSLVNEQMKAGLLTPEQARTSKYRNIITRSIGFESNVVVDTSDLDLQDNDTFVLCTDGLTTLVADQEIGDLIMHHYLHEAPQMLVDLANHRGGDDNTTVIVVYVTKNDGIEQNPERIRLSANTNHGTMIYLPES